VPTCLVPKTYYKEVFRGDIEKVLIDETVSIDNNTKHKAKI